MCNNFCNYIKSFDKNKVTSLIIIFDILGLFDESPLVTGETNIGAEGATTPETLRQKDRYRNNSGKQALASPKD